MIINTFYISYIILLDIHYTIFFHIILSYFMLFLSFRDVASLVHEQGHFVDEVVVSTEKSHERAQAGLKEVQQAAARQSTCMIS